MEEIVIPNLEDDEDDYLPSLSRPVFGAASSTSSLPDTDPYSNSHRSNLSSDSSYAPGKLQTTTPTRPGLQKASASFSVGAPTLAHGFGQQQTPGSLGKFNNASSSSLVTPGTSISSSGAVKRPGLATKGSFASIKNAFKQNHSTPAPPLPAFDRTGPPGYPALKNPFSRYDSPMSPRNPAGFKTPVKGKNLSSSTTASPMSRGNTADGQGRKYSIASSHRSQGGRSMTSNGSVNFRADDHPMPALPPIPSRQTPSRLGGRHGSDVGSYLGRMRGGSVDLDDGEFGRTPGEEALRVVFVEFREAAGNKVQRVCARPLNSHPSLSTILEAGIDPQFDNTITSLSQCATRHARRVVDLLISWCRDYCGNIGASEVRSHLDRSMGLQMKVEDAAAILQARKSSAARFIMNRALIELLKITPKDSLDQELGMTLETNAFNAYRSEKPEDVMQFPHKKAVSQLQIQLLGQLSKTRFLTVSDRFVRELSKYATNQQPTKESEARIEHLLKGMRHLQLKVYPEDELEMSAEFIQSLSAFYASAHGQSLKIAYAETFTHLLHPVIETATAEVNHPVWAQAMAVILDRALGMVGKARYWNAAFPLMVTALGVSPREVFIQQWQNVVDAIMAKFKDRNTKSVAMGAFIRLLWVYLHRCHESSTSTRKRLDHLIRVLFASSQYLYPSEIPSEGFIAVLHYVMTRQTDYGEEFVVEFLGGRSATESGAERSTAVVKAVNHTLRVIELEKHATWPQSPDFTNFDHDSFAFESSGETMPFDTETKPEVSDLLKKAGPAFMNLLVECDNDVRNLLLSNDSVAISGHASSHTMDNPVEIITSKHGDVYVSYPARYAGKMRLMEAVIEALPRCLPKDPKWAELASILCRATFSADPNVCVAAGNALKRMAQDPQRCLLLVATYRGFVFETRHIFKDTFVGAKLMDSQFERVVKLWLDMLLLLVGHQRVAEAQADDEDGQKAPTADASQIAQIEASAIFLLCSSALSLRKLAGQILVAARDLESQQRLPSAAFRYSRLVPDKLASAGHVLDIYEHVLNEKDIDALNQIPWLSQPEKARLEIVNNNRGKEGGKLLQRIAEGESSRDAVLWLSVLPVFIGRVADRLPKVSQELRTVVGGLVLRLQAHVALVAGGVMRGTPSRTGGSLATRSSSDIAILADHWRAYLSILCVTLNPANGPAPPTPPVQRSNAKDVIILNQEAISTPVLFTYLTSLLGWEDTRFKDAAVHALGSIRQGMMRPLAEQLLNVTRRLMDGAKVGTAPREGTTKKTPNSTIWTAVAHIFRLISPLILDHKSSNHLANLSSMIGFIKVTWTLLSDRTVKEDYDLQNLRRSFCIVVENLTNALGKLDSSDRFLGEEMRGAVFKLCYEWCLVGRRPDVAKARESQMLQAAAGGYRGERDRASYLDNLQNKTKLLSMAAAETMAGLCQGKLISVSDSTPAQQASDHIVEPLLVLRWIRGMFGSANMSHNATAKRALFALIKYNWDCERLLDEVLHQSFGEGEQFTLESSFFGVVADLLLEGHLDLPVEQVACLALSKLGHPVSTIRQRAFQLAQSLLSHPDDLLVFSKLLPSVGSSSAAIYRQAQDAISGQLASIYADNAFSFLSECTTRLSQLEAPRRQATLSVIRSWVQYLDMVSDMSDLSPEDASLQHQALHNLVYLGVRFGEDHPEEIKVIVLSFAGSSSSQNTTALVKFLFEQGGKRKSPDFVEHAQRMVACLASSSAGDDIFEDICNFVEPNAMVALPEADVPPSPMSSLANLDTIMSAPSARSQTFSTGQLALIFAGELLPHRLGDFELSKKLPALLQAALIQCDSASSALRDQSQTVLFQVLRAWISDVSLVSPQDAHAIWTSAETKVTALAMKKQTIFWKSDDNGGSDVAFMAPPKMTDLVIKILGILLPLQPRIRQQWGELALSWATTCPMRHLACRSFQIFRILSPNVKPRMISDTLARLSSTIASSSQEIQAFNCEVLRTFASIVQNLGPTEAQSNPQIFWCSFACLTTPYENEFSEVIDLLSHVLDKTNLSDPSVVQLLNKYRPADWVGPAPYLQSLLLVGLRSSKTSFMTFDLIRRLTSASIGELVDAPNDRLIHGFLAALPWMLHSTDLGEPNEELAEMALDLASIADQQGRESFSRLLTSFAKVRFRSKDDFIRQAASLLRDYMPTHALDIVTLLLGFVLNTHDWMREKSMQVLKLILQSPEARAPLQTHGNELLQPLLNLLNTKHATQALDVLDMPITATTAASVDNHVPASPSFSGDIFGLVEESGWSVPRAKELSSLTRENVRAVFNTCTTETRAASAHFSVVQFADMRPFDYNASQVSLDLPSSPPINGEGSMENASIGDLVGALHSLGHFFEDGDTMAGLGNGTSSPLPNYNMSRHAASNSDVSERRVRAIMARSHQHQSSITSPIYETSPAHSRINGRPFRHNHTRSNTIASESSMTSSSMDERENATQRLNFSIQSGGSSTLGSLTPVKSHGQSHSTGSVNIPLGVSESRRIHLPNHSMSSMSDMGDQSAFGLDEEGAASSMGGLPSTTSMTSISSAAGYGGAVGRQGGWNERERR
ncbi:hypothetical protein L202_08027 [Cryptococcus amylolentus CBS 6039]|uniref:Cell polarity protein mor2 n=2 Tax=Cryptococcus amylolentus TaxID=104669 RepID=A0A1E3HCM9_9TREE|nr:hypothetical protein L202_08027 [Cryptococcus amylolentus CBS 6039]ODN73526.1 hypothetical protein L202_08027 [Cryptococcus amylolentus CBS 6039]ODN99269.1 hypothetical protein I350_07429 [Cryptococcus amylolentus CBS 6273]